MVRVRPFPRRRTPSPEPSPSATSEPVQPININMSAVEPAPIEETGANTSSSGSYQSSTALSQPNHPHFSVQSAGEGSKAATEQHVEADGACTSSSGSSHPSTSSVHQNRSAKFFKIGSKTPTSRGNGARQSACSTDDASALSDVSKEQHSDGKCIFEKVSVGIVAKRDDSVIGDEDGAALSGHRQEDPSNRFLLSVGPSHASDATVYMEHAISTATLAEKSDVQRPNPNATMLQTRMPNPNDVYTLRSSRADRYPVPMDAMDNSDVRLYFDMHRTTDQSLTSSVTGTMSCWGTSVSLV